MKKITIWLFALFAFTQVNAQLFSIDECLATVSSSTYGPMYSVATAGANNRSAALYPSSQLTGIAGQTLNTIYYKRLSATGTMAGTPNFKVYMKEVSVSDYGTGALDWATEIATATLVYDSDPSAAVGSNDGWKSFPMSTNFVYSGTQNLAVFTEYINTTASSSIGWAYEYQSPCITTSNSNTGKYSNNTSGTFSATLGSSNYRRPLIGFDFVVSCNAPNTVVSSNLTTSSIDLSWSENAIQPQNGYEYYNSTSSTPPSPTETPTGTTATGVSTVSLSSLTPATNYYFWVRGNCGAADKSIWIGPLAYTTLCVDVAAFVENFDTSPTGTGNLPVCWSKVGTSNNVYTTTGALAPMSPTNRLYMNISASTTAFAVMPPVSNLQANTHRLKFKVYCTTTGKTMSVGYFTTPGDETTYVEINPFPMQGANVASTEEFTVIPNNIPAGVNQLVFSIPAGTATTLYIDDVKWEVNSSCVEPSALTATSITNTSATLGWANGGPETMWDIQYGVAGFSIGSGTIVNGVTVNPHPLSGLTANTLYEFYVRGVCAGAVNSSWSGPFLFKTQCNDVTEFTENFEGYPTGTANPLPDCWGEVNNGTGNSYITTGANAPMSPANRLYMTANGVTPTETCAVLPSVSNLQANTHRLRFKAYSSSGTDRFVAVGYMTDPSDINSFIQIQEVNLPGTALASTQEFTIVPGVLPAGVKHLAIKNSGYPSGTTIVYIDDVVWEAIPACPEPTSISATNVTSSTADLSWVEMGSASIWNIEYGPVGFTQGTGGTVVTGVSTNPYTLSSLNASTDYEYYVQADCGGTAGSSVWVGPFAFSTLCNAFVAPYLENFDSLPLTSPYTDLPNCWEPQTGPDYWDVTDDATNTGHTYLPNIGDHTTTTANYMWIDASSDITANEMVSPLIDMSGLTTPYAGFWFASDNTTNTINHTIALDVWDGTSWLNIATESGNFTGWVEVAATVPSTVPTTTKFRIYATANPAGTTSDYFYNDLGVDDFFVMEAPTCIAPTSLTADNITAFTADLGWTENGTATVWDIEWGVLGFTPTGTPNITGTTTNPYNLTGLTPDTDYSFYVRTDCGAVDGQSIWAGPFNFTTLISCPAPSALTVANILTDSADLGWTENGTSTTWNIEYGPAGFTQGTGGTLVTGLTTNPYALTNLTPATTYDFYVQTDCGSTNGLSVWVGPFSFTTACIPFTAPYLENFDSLPLTSPYTALPNCWETQSGPDFWDVTNDVTNALNTYAPNVGDHTTGSSNYMWIDSSTNITANEMVSPLIDMSALTTPAVGFWFLSENTTNSINHTIALDVWDGSAWLNIKTETGNFTNWVKVTAAVPSTVPTTTKFRIYAIANPNGTSSDYYFNDLGVDDFFVEEAPTVAPICATNIVATPDTACGNEPTLITWDAVSGADSYYMTIGTTTGGNDVLDNVDIGSAPSYSFVGMINTTYYYTITPYNAQGSATGCVEQSFMTFATGCYCFPSGTSTATYIDDFSTTSASTNITNSSSGLSTNNYGDFTTLSTTLGSTQSFDFSVGIVGGTVGCAVWVDWDNDYSFDPSDMLYSTTSYGSGPFTGTITVPASTPSGNYRMRVMIDWNDSNPGDDDACSFTSGRGEVEDYIVTVDNTLSSQGFDVSSFVAYPNPVNDVLNLSYTSEINSVDVINLLGQKVISREVGSTSTQIDMTALTAGAYIVNITIDDVIKSIKVIKQ